MIPEEKYYSFKIGFSGSKRSEWVLKDWKIPAIDVREAVLLFFLHNQYKSRMNSKWFGFKKPFYLPDKDYAFMTIREIIEYRVARKSGYFLVQYKKINVYTSHQILEFLR